MQQIFLKQELKLNDTFIFDEANAHHIKNVLRMKDNDELFVVDNHSNKWLAKITINDDIKGTIIEKVLWNSELPYNVTIAQGLIKGDRWDIFLEKSTEFGVNEIIPLNLKRNVVKIDKKDENKKIERWQKIVESGAKQSKRNIVPKVNKIMNLNDLIDLDYDYKLIAYENDIGVNTLKELTNNIKDNDRVLLVIGAEGGIALEEVDYLKEHGFKTCGLGQRILRAESASLYFLSVLSYHGEK